MRWLVLVAAILWAPAANALDSNDRLTFTMAGGERVEGWFVRAEVHAIVVSVKGVPVATRVPFKLIDSVRLNGKDVSLDRFQIEASRAHEEWKAWVLNPPPHPHAAGVVAGSLLLPGGGQLILGETKSGFGYLVADLVLLAAGALEVSTEGRMGVLVPLVGLDLVLRLSSASEAAQTTNRRRRRLRESRAILESPTQR